MKLKKCVLLLPTKFNDGTAVPQELMDEVIKDIDREFDGHSVDGYVDGAYRMADGTMAYDRSLRIWVAVQPEHLGELRKLARLIAGRLKQETLWFETSEAEIEFLPPLDDDGDEA